MRAARSRHPKTVRQAGLLPRLREPWDGQPSETYQPHALRHRAPQHEQRAVRGLQCALCRDCGGGLWSRTACRLHSEVRDVCVVGNGCCLHLFQWGPAQEAVGQGPTVARPLRVSALPVPAVSGSSAVFAALLVNSNSWRLQLRAPKPLKDGLRQLFD